MTFSRLKVNLSYMTVQNACITFTIVVDPLPASVSLLSYLRTSFT